MVGHVKLAVVSMTWEFGIFLYFLFERLLWSRNYLFVCLFFEILRFSELVGLACRCQAVLLHVCTYRWPTENRKLCYSTEQLGDHGDVFNVYLFPSLLEGCKFLLLLTARVA